MDDVLEGALDRPARRDGTLVEPASVTLTFGVARGGHLEDHIAQLQCHRISARTEVLEELARQIVDGCLDEALQAGAEAPEVRQ
jgi:hypothetical protein